MRRRRAYEVGRWGRGLNLLRISDRPEVPDCPKWTAKTPQTGDGSLHSRASTADGHEHDKRMQHGSHDREVNVPQKLCHTGPEAAQRGCKTVLHQTVDWTAVLCAVLSGVLLLAHSVPQFWSNRRCAQPIVHTLEFTKPEHHWNYSDFPQTQMCLDSVCVIKPYNVPNRHAAVTSFTTCPNCVVTQ